MFGRFGGRAGKGPLMKKAPLTALVAAAALGIGAYCLDEWARPKPDEPFFEGLGSYHRKVTTSSPLAQRYFDQGLAFFYGFNFDESRRSFQAAAAADPRCAMAYWGIAMAQSEPGDAKTADSRADDALQAAAQAREQADAATPVERSLIEALGRRYAGPMPAKAYADAMRGLWREFPHDPDVGALTAHALMRTHSGAEWTLDGQPRGGALEAIAILEVVLAQFPKHPFALHLMVHLLEASPHPERANAAADSLRDLAPGLGHLLHMPSHIDIRCGRWDAAVAATQKGREADQAYLRIVPRPDSYREFISHNNHLLAYAAAMAGRSRLASEAIEQLLADLPADYIDKNGGLVDFYFGLRYELHVRFGQWEAMLAEAAPPTRLPIAHALLCFGRGTALAALGRIAEAEDEQRRFRQALLLIGPEAMCRKNTADDVLAVGDGVLAGEILYRKGNVDQAIARLTEAVSREDRLDYSEPPEWIQPARHALGAVLMDAGRYAPAESVYGEDLKRHPENGWSLYGLSRSLLKQGKKAEAAAVAARFEKAWQHADITLTASCLCLPEKH
jgi:tetratricopeptide (TPR) repeat protein